MIGESRFHDIIRQILNKTRDIDTTRSIIEESDNFTDLEKEILIRLLDEFRRYEARINRVIFN